MFAPVSAELAISAAPFPPTPIPATLIRLFAPHTRDGRYWKEKAVEAAAMNFRRDTFFII